MGCDGVEDVVIATNSAKKVCHASSANDLSVPPGGVICAKASMLLQVCYIVLCLEYSLALSINCC